MVRVCVGDTLADQALDASIGAGDVRAVRLALGRRLPAEVGERDPVGDVAALDGKVEPGPKLDLAPSSEAGAPFGTERPFADWAQFVCLSVVAPQLRIAPAW